MGVRNDARLRRLAPNRHAGCPLGRVASDFWWEVEELREAPDGRIVALIVANATGRESGVPVSMPLANVWTVRDGKVVRFEVFLDRGQALEHAGLAAPGGIPNRE